MTYRELAQKEHPERIFDWYEGGVYGCPHEIVPEAKELCERGLRDGNEEKCRRCWNQEISEQPSQSAKADKGGRVITLKLERDDVENLIEFFDISFFSHLKALLDDGELDNIEYLKSMTRVYDELHRAQGAEEET